MYRLICTTLLIVIMLSGCVSKAVSPVVSDGTTPLPGISVQALKPLPRSQKTFRINSVRAVNNDLLKASRAASDAYSLDGPESGWKRYEIKRKNNIFGAGITVVLIKIDDQLKTVEVAIRGTASFDDVLKDLNVKAELDDQLGIPIHAGFRSIAGGVISLIREKFPESEYSEYSFKLYGHSLGGAVANVVSMYLHEDGRHVDIVVTLGAPRFTTNEGARKYQVLNQRTYRVVRCDDVIPFLPPPNFFGWSNGSYESNGNLFLLLKPPYFDYSVGIDIERDFIKQLRTELANLRDRQKLAYGHRVDNYDNLLYLYSPEGISFWKEPGDILPVSYQLSMQAELCTKRLSGQ